jgi:hypothetical protein
MAKQTDTLLGRPREPDAQVAYWLDEIAQAKTREKDFRKTGQKVLDIYDGTNQATVPFNILFSNTETLLPAIYSAIPRPVVERRFKDDDPLGKHAAEAGRRMLEFLLDTNLQDYDPFDTVLRHTTLDALLPGRGNCCVKYDATITGLDEADASDPAPETAADADAADIPSPAVEYEIVCLETKGWNRVYYGYAKKWSKVPWIAFEEYIDQVEAIRLFGRTLATKIRYTQDQSDLSEDAPRPRTQEDRHQGHVKTACLYQIWDRHGGTMVRYLSPQYTEGMLKEEEDPLHLSGFFPCPKPLQFLDKTHSTVPTALFKIYENQAMELNIIQVRINNLVKACKARGLYDGSLGDEVQKLMSADENELVPAESASSLAAEKGLQNAIWFMPLEVIQSTLQTLYTARESCKQVIYEITGISDILRGASQASETATAQTIKNQWGTLRLKRYQKTVAQYARDLMRLMLELAASKLSEETWGKMTGLPFNTSQQAQQLQQLSMIAQQTGRPLDPQTQATLQAPSWGDILTLLQDDLARAYRIDIETNSTVEPEAVEDQKNITALMTALSQYLNGVGPLIAKGVMPFGAAQSMMLAIARRFRFGSEVEDYIKAMQPPKPEDDGKAQQQQMKDQMQAMQDQMAVKQQQAEMALQMKTMQAEKELLAQKVDLELREMQLKADSEKFALQQQVATAQSSMRDQVHSVKTSAQDQVRTVKDASSKKEAQSAHMADTKLSSSVGAIESVTQQMASMNASLLDAIKGQADHTARVLQEVTKAVSAPRRRKAIRGKDGRIEAVEDQVA